MCEIRLTKLNVFSLLSVGMAIAPLTSNVVLQTTVMAETGTAWYNCFTREVWTPEKKVWCDRWNRLQNLTYSVPSRLDSKAELVPVTLKNGRYQRADGKLFVQLVNEKNWMTFGDINGDGKQDAAVVLGVALDPVGRSLGTYLAAVMDVDGQPRAIAPIRLGERMMLNGPIAIANNAITVPLLTQTQVINRVFAIHETLQEQQ